MKQDDNDKCDNCQRCDCAVCRLDELLEEMFDEEYIEGNLPIQISEE